MAKKSVTDISKIPPGGRVNLSPAAKKIVMGPEPKTMGEALANAQALIDERGDSDASMETIRGYVTDIERDTKELKTKEEMLHDMMVNTPEYDEVVECLQLLNTARKKLGNALRGNRDYNNMAEDIANRKAKIKDAKQILSDYLVAYFAETRERQIELSADDARVVVVTGRLGKRKEYQTSMFSGGDNHPNGEASGEPG